MSVAEKFVIRGRLAGVQIASKLLHIPQPMLFVGPDSSLALARNIASFGFSKVLVVTDQVLTDLGVTANLLEVVRESGMCPTVFNEIQPDPNLEQVKEGLDRYRAEACEAVVAIGGGSVIDAAKVIAAGARTSRPVEKLAGLLRAYRGRAPLYVVPTTAGTGSEATVAAVISRHVAGTCKKSLYVDPCLVPDAAALDPRLMLGLPRSITAATGIDVLTHVIEAYVSTFATAQTDQYAKAGLRLVAENLPALLKNGKSLRRRENMAMASYYGGLAVTHAGVGYVHALSHQVGPLLGLPHGEANALFLRPVLTYSLPHIETRLAELADALGLTVTSQSMASRAERFLVWLDEFLTAAGVGNASLDLSPECIRSVARSALAEAHGTYAVPRYLTHRACEQLLSLNTTAK